MELAISHLSKRYANSVQALDDVSLAIPAGMFGLLGPNGAGKSTLMRTLATLQEADSGAATFEGVDAGPIDMLASKERVREVLGYLPQEFGVYPKVTAIALLDHLAGLKGISDAGKRKTVVQQLLQRTNLWEARYRRLGTFSGGMKQRFGIAQALLGNPKLLIVDEPTAGLDPEERLRFLNLLADIGESVVIILSTHIVADVSDLCRQVAIINRGKVVTSGDPLTLVAELKDRLWRRFITHDELGTLKAQHRIVSSRRTAGRLVVRVYSEGSPGEGFEPTAADLEDVYFLALHPAAPAAPAVPPGPAVAPGAQAV
jgi:ABC-type multidrug transport system ATPase subunit